MIRLLLDANVSPKTGAFLKETFGFDVVDLIGLGLSHLEDHEVVELAIREERILVSFDLDFGAIFYRRELGRFGAILLRFENQTVAATNNALRQFFENQAPTIALKHSLVVLDESKVRVIREP